MRYKCRGDDAMPHAFKVLLFGDGAVGKTTLAHRYVTGTFLTDTHITIGVEIHVKNLIVDDDPVTLQVWDLGGEDRFRFILPTYCLGASGGIFIFDVTSRRTLLSLSEWMKVIQESKNTFPIIAAGTKVDLEDLRQVQLEDAIATAATYGIEDVMEISSKTGQNVEELFEKLSRVILEHNTW